MRKAKKSLIYTKTGDSGETSLFGGSRVAKTSPVIQAVGSIDELNACLGVAVTQIKTKKTQTILESIQAQLFEIGAEIANPEKAGKGVNIFKLGKKQINFLETNIDLYDSKLPRLTNFILPGGTYSSSLLQVSRSICRRAERNVLTLKKINSNILKYLNRLSDLLFVLSRYENYSQKAGEKIWKKPFST